MKTKNKLQKKLKTGKWKEKKLKHNTDGIYRYRITGVKKELALAWLIDINGIEYWFPKSQCQIGIHPDGRTYAIDIPNWLAKAKGLI